MSNRHTCWIRLKGGCEAHCIDAQEESKRSMLSVREDTEDRWEGVKSPPHCGFWYLEDMFWIGLIQGELFKRREKWMQRGSNRTTGSNSKQAESNLRRNIPKSSSRVSRKSRNLSFNYVELHLHHYAWGCRSPRHWWCLSRLGHLFILHWHSISRHKSKLSFCSYWLQVSDNYNSALSFASRT
jgi:hypothetical protein